MRTDNIFLIPKYYMWYSACRALRCHTLLGINMGSASRCCEVFIKKIFKYNTHNVIFKNNYATTSILSRPLSNVPVEYTQSRDPAPLFFNEDIQNLLKQLTRVNMDKVFRHRQYEDKKLAPPVYKFMTDEELNMARESAAEQANEMLQMPPVIKVREPINEVLSQDPALIGYDNVKYVFTDITYGISNRDRLIVVRDTEGNLVKADWDTRQRMSQIYFPLQGRKVNTPRMFADNYLASLLERKEYEFILDSACVQFEPDDSEYQKVTSLTYQSVNEHNDFEILRSTRHFGPLVFYLAWHKCIDNLLLELIETSHVGDANSLILLHNKLHSSETVGQDIKLDSGDDTRLVELFITEKSTKKGQLELALQSYKELLKQRLELEEGIRKAHGAS